MRYGNQQKVGGVVGMGGPMNVMHAPGSITTTAANTQ